MGKVIKVIDVMHTARLIEIEWESNESDDDLNMDEYSKFALHTCYRGPSDSKLLLLCRLEGSA